MYLKRLDMQGFKSFPEKVSLYFNPGITSIVGPNGSGKSNVTDAIRWVLGEQSIKALRGSKMEDVIFAGTEHRKPLGFAEVSLTIDNKDKQLPIEFSEVTVTRRVYRSGESEYFINKTPCRLKDIHELFFDTGIGKDGYSIIGQGRIDEILSAHSEDRRIIFEEASGIMKYKSRKHEAERKLEATEQNLLRINDIIAEIETQLEPLKQQAEVAKKYLALREELKTLEVNFYIENISKAREKIKELEEQYDSIKENINNENTKLESATRNNRQQLEYMKKLEERMNTAKEEYYSLEGNLERCNSEISLNEEKIGGLERNIVRLEEEIFEIKDRFAKLLAEKNTKQEKLKYLNEKHDEYSSRLAEYEQKLASVIAALDEEERHIEGLKTKLIEMLDVLSDKKTQINNLISYRENLAKRLKSIENEIYQLSNEIDTEKFKKEELLENIRRVEDIINRLSCFINELNSKKSELEASLNNLREKQNAVKSKLQFMSSRYKMLKDMEQNMEGYNRSVRAIMHACSQNADFSKGIYGALAQLIKVEKKYETAIEIALGSALQNIVTATEEDAQRAIEFLKQNKAGRATFLPIASVKGKYMDDALLNEIRNIRGFCAIASDVVSCESRFKGIITNLLGRVVVVGNLESGINLARRFSYNFRIVTLDGDFINTTGSITGGSLENKGTSILSRNRELYELSKSIEKLQEQVVSLKEEADKAVSELNTLLEQISFHENDIKNNELVKIRDENHLSMIEENIKKLQARLEMQRTEKQQLLRQEKETGQEIEKCLVEQMDIENKIDEAKNTINEYNEMHKETRSTRDILYNDVTNYRISVNSILESMEEVKESIAKMDNEKDSIEKSIKKREVDKHKCKEEISKLKQINEGLVLTIKKHEEEKTGRTLEIDRITEERKIIEEEVSELANMVNDINKNIILLNEEMNRISIRKAKLESEVETIQNKMWDEYELTYNNALMFKKEIGSHAQAQKRINEIKNEMRSLEPVNISAIHEFVKTKERYEFMTVQRDDMENAKEKLHKVINEMTAIMKKQFLECFKQINDNFNAVFKELFNGGRAKLVLLEEDKVLESGIEIEAQPPGKKLQNMMLLSGGERALTAIALLFAILRLRPTPFCVLDEIEVSLDDANVQRFCQYMKRYARKTQFIVVTHRKDTIESSNTLYGVTMQEHGISKIVSMKIDEMVS